jgi:hypothetical protein
MRRPGFAARCEEAATPFRQGSPLPIGAAPWWGIAPKFKKSTDGGAEPPPHIGRRSREPLASSSQRKCFFLVYARGLLPS